MTDLQHTKSPDDIMIESAFQELLDEYLSSNHRKKVEIIQRAFQFARKAHKGVRRRSGEPYIMHPIAVARIVISEIGLGSTSICAALLHDVVEDTEFTIEDIETNFGSQIASIVEGLTKISGGIFGDNASSQAENFRKLLLSMKTDIRTVIIKMADRLHNMRTLSSLRPEKQAKISGETLYIYAPLAHRLGLFKIKQELEDLSFRYEHPEKYAEIMARVSETESHRKQIVEQFVAPVRKKLDAAGFKYEIKARVKSAYSIFRKMEKKHLSFDDIYDIYAVRVIFENDDDTLEKIRCWQIYTFFTDGHKVHPDRLRDWISNPKANGYRALHLTVMGPEGKWIEVQIRSRKMDEIAELGYAAHWKYKTGEYDDEPELEQWMNTVKDILANPEPNAIDFLDSIKLNLFSSEIYVFTPKGRLITLPTGATVLDMAYAIHTRLGETCMAGKIAHRLVAISHTLESGDQVEIISSESQTPQPEWLGCCHTAKAKQKVRQYLRKNRSAMLKLGEKTLRDAMEKAGVELTSRFLDRMVKKFSLKSTDDLFEMIGREEIDLSAHQLKEIGEQKKSSVLSRLIRNPFKGKNANKEMASHIDRSETFVLHPDPVNPNYRVEKCCFPVPGDDVIAFVDENETVTLHQISCPVALRMQAGEGDRIIDTRWEGLSDLFDVTIAVDGIDRHGILEEITNVISLQLGINIRSLNIKADGQVFRCLINVKIDTADTVRRICRALKKIRNVEYAQRVS